jgi:hypothetical protein
MAGGLIAKRVDVVAIRTIGRTNHVGNHDKTEAGIKKGIV